MNRAQTLLAALSEQMYRDIRFITQSNPTVVVDDDTVKMYNSLLTEVRKSFPHAVESIAFEEMTPRTLKYKDALVVVGQLACLVKVMTGGENLAAAPAASVSQAASQPVARSGQTVLRVAEAPAEPEEAPEAEPPLDPELYGPTPPLHLNEDGTVKFSLD
ncbi:MAG: hypothetical protein PWP23_1200 [Candidatus Sumerlaeota bacterium]|nr:hypothetical protein [Candidatus Sumerlaeota bacterium]